MKKCNGLRRIGVNDTILQIVFIKQAPKEARGSMLDIVSLSIARTAPQPVTVVN